MELYKKLIVIAAMFLVYLIILSGVVWISQKAQVEFSVIDKQLNSTVVLSSDLGWGSGVFIAPGVILTAAHVVDYTDFKYMDVFLYDGSRLYIEDVKFDIDDDLALVFVDYDKNDYCEISTQTVKVGDKITHIGSPLLYLYRFNRSEGVVSGLNDLEEGFSFRIDAMAEAGCSGGPVFIGDKVIGVVVAGTYNIDSLSLCEGADRLDKELIDASQDW